jgi:hypothetical protein
MLGTAHHDMAAALGTERKTLGQHGAGARLKPAWRVEVAKLL